MECKEPVAQVRDGNVKVVLMNDNAVIPARLSEVTGQWEVAEGFSQAELPALIECLRKASQWLSKKGQTAP